jgi:hypothetical protein
VKLSPDRYLGPHPFNFYVALLILYDNPHCLYVYPLAWLQRMVFYVGSPMRCNYTGIVNVLFRRFKHVDTARTTAAFFYVRGIPVSKCGMHSLA